MGAIALRLLIAAAVLWLAHVLYTDDDRGEP